MINTLDYYNQNADDFIQGTISVDFASTQDRFIKRIAPGALILDFGCGSGRDTKYFLDKGFIVEATDGSEELCKRASEYTGITVKQMLFQELDAKEKYAGIWACSSILHLPKDELKGVLVKMAEFNSAEKINIEVAEIESTDVMTGDRDKRMYLYYQLINSIKKADRVDIIVSFLMESGVKMLLSENFYRNPVKVYL